MLKLRLLEEGDLPLLLAWSHIPDIWEYMPTSRKCENLTWEKHRNWWLMRSDRLDWMILYKELSEPERPIGVVHISRLSKSIPEIGLYIAESGLWGRELGPEILREVVLWFKYSTYYKPVLQAVIHPKNTRSVKLFKSLRFKKVKGGREGQDVYEYHVS